MLILQLDEKWLTMNIFLNKIVVNINGCLVSFLNFLEQFSGQTNNLIKLVGFELSLFTISTPVIRKNI